MKWRELVNPFCNRLTYCYFAWVRIFLACVPAKRNHANRIAAGAANAGGRAVVSGKGLLVTVMLVGVVAFSGLGRYSPETRGSLPMASVAASNARLKAIEARAARTASGSRA